MIDTTLTNTMLPDLSNAFLGRMFEGRTLKAVTVGDGGFDYVFDEIR
jgi:type VI secretion system protein VasG